MEGQYEQLRLGGDRAAILNYVEASCDAARRAIEYGRWAEEAMEECGMRGGVSEEVGLGMRGLLDALSWLEGAYEEIEGKRKE